MGTTTGFEPASQKGKETAMLKKVMDVTPEEGAGANAPTLHRKVFTVDKGERECMGFIHLASKPTPAGHKTTPYRKSAEETIFTLSGSMDMVMDDVEYRLTPGTALAISRGQVISHAKVGPEGWEALTGFCSQCPLYLAEHPRFPAGSTEIPRSFPNIDSYPAGRLPAASYERLVRAKEDVTPAEGANAATAQTVHRDVFSPSAGNRSYQSFMYMESKESPPAPEGSKAFTKSGEEVIYTLRGTSATIHNGEKLTTGPGTAFANKRGDQNIGAGTSAGGTDKVSWYCMKCPLYLRDHPRLT